MSDIAEILRRHSAALDGPLRDAVERVQNLPPRLKEAITYSLFAPGKRLRPALVLESCIACGGRADDPSALAAAVAIELIHTFSLVHDDLPAMDDDDLRRGRPTNHKVFGEALAILAGDAMVTMAFETLATQARSSIAPRLVRELADAAGPGGMIGGQALDIQSENKQLQSGDLQMIHMMKTAALISCACRMGALAADAEAKVPQISQYALRTGLAFQIVDDILDVTATPEQLGKKTRKDAGIGKNTYPQIHGLEQSWTAARRLVDEAIAALQEFGPAADGLRIIAKFVTERQK